jgi:hypothetical protein
MRSIFLIETKYCSNNFMLIFNLPKGKAKIPALMRAEFTDETRNKEEYFIYLEEER